jgi:hypothetical protein
VPISSLSLAVVGADYPNRRGPGRRFELQLCTPGEKVELVPEPKNPADPRAVAVFSARGVQIGYLTAERCTWIAGMIGDGREILAIFQRQTAYGAVIRVALDGAKPILPRDVSTATEPDDPEGDFYPDFIPPDD